MAQNHLMTAETHDEVLILLSSAPKTNNHEVPSYISIHLRTIPLKGLQSGSIPFGKNPICWRVTILSRIHCKAGPVSVRLVFETRGNCLGLCPSIIRMMVFLVQSTVPSAATILQLQCVNPDQSKTERSENRLCRCGKSWLTNFKFFFSRCR